jgi:hypothetical protein
MKEEKIIQEVAELVNVAESFVANEQVTLAKVTVIVFRHQHR